MCVISCMLWPRKLWPTLSSLKLDPAHPSRNPQAWLSDRGLGISPRIIRGRSSTRSETEFLTTALFKPASAKSFERSIASHTKYRTGFSRF